MEPAWFTDRVHESVTPSKGRFTGSRTRFMITVTRTTAPVRNATSLPSCNDLK